MVGKAHPNPDLAPLVPQHSTFQERLELWVDLNTCEQFLLAGLSREIGPDGDLQTAYRRWYEERMEEHDRTMMHLLAELDRRLGADG